MAKPIKSLKIVLQDFEVTVAANQKGQGDNRYDFPPSALQLNKPGKYLVTITKIGDDEPLKNGSFELHINPPSAEFCTASGPGVDGGDSRNPVAAFTVAAKNQEGEPVTAGGDPFKAHVTGPDGQLQPIELQDNGDGTYSGEYPVDEPGDYVVAVTLDDQPVANSPFTARMEAGNAGQCWAEGEGLAKGKTGIPCLFKVHSVDTDGAEVNVGGDPFTVAVAGPNGPVECEMVDNGDGTYDGAYTPDLPGDYTIDISLHGEAIKDNPFDAQIKVAPDASQSYCKGKGFNKAFDNKTAKFKVYALDKDGNPVSGDDCQVTVKPSEEASELEEVKVDVVDNEDGTYSVEFAPDTAGDYVIDVTLDGDRVKDVPKNIRVLEGADVSKMGYGYFKFTLQAVNKQGEAKSEGGDEFTVEIADLEGNPVEATTKDHGDGSYSTKYKFQASQPIEEGPVQATEYKVNVCLNDDHVPGSEFTQFF